MLLVYFYNYFVLCMIAYFFSNPYLGMMDVYAFAYPMLPLLVSQVMTTFMLEDTQTYVPAAVRNILAVWYAFM